MAASVLPAPICSSMIKSPGDSNDKDRVSLMIAFCKGRGENGNKFSNDSSGVFLGHPSQPNSDNAFCAWPSDRSKYCWPSNSRSRTFTSSASSTQHGKNSLSEPIQSATETKPASSITVPLSGDNSSASVSGG